MKQDVLFDEYKKRSVLLKKIEPLLKKLLEKELYNIRAKIVFIESRIKTYPSFYNKATTRGYSEPFKEIKDLLGLRVILHYKDDIDEISRIIDEKFKINKNKCEDKRKRYDPDQLGIQDVQLIVKIPSAINNRDKLEELNYDEFEIQIRSILQHAWASKSHILDYKTYNSIPDKLRRKLFLTMANLEIIDDIFIDLKKDYGNLVQDYSRKVLNNDFNIPINKDSLEKYLQHNVKREEWEKLGIEAGIPELLDSHPEKKKFPTTWDINNLIPTLIAAGFKSINDFHIALQKIKISKRDLTEYKDKAKSINGKSVYSAASIIIKVQIAINYANQIPDDFNFHHQGEPEFGDAALKVMVKNKKKLINNSRIKK